MNIVARFEIPYYQILNEKRKLVSDLPDFAKDLKLLTKLYHLMVLSRTFDTKAIALQRTGKMGTYPSTRGQEAVFVGVGNAMAPNDVFVPYYRDIAVLTQRGVKLSDILLYWGGDESGNCYANPATNFPFNVPIASQTLHAVGVATAIQIKKENRAVLTMCGDGATSQGDFYEAMNVAGIWKLPVVFVINNNQWAISVPRSAQTAAKTLAQKAIAAGFSGEQVDGNDILAIHDRVTQALKKARETHEPTLIEMVCYRQSDHTTADDASRYETKDMRENEWKKEPILRFKDYLESIDAWDETQELALHKRCSEEVEEAVKTYLAYPSPTPEMMFDYLYETLPDAYVDQREALKKLGS